MYSKKALQYAQTFVDGDLLSADKLHLAAANIQQIMADVQASAIESAAVTAEAFEEYNLAESIRGLLPPS